MGERIETDEAPRDVVTIAPGEAVRAGLDRMRQYGISCLVVTEDDRPVGIITERNILWAAAHQGPSFAERPVREFMSAPVRTAVVGTHLAEICRLLAKNRLRHLVLVDDTGRAQDVVTQSDLVERLGCATLSGAKRVAEIMTRDVVTAAGGSPVGEAVRSMAERSISCLLVVRDGRPAGILTERDVVRLLLDRPHPEKLCLYDVMSCPVISIDSQQSVYEAAELMKKYRVRRLVVLREDRRIEGLVTQSNIVRGLTTPYVRTLESALAEKDKALQAVGKSLLEKTAFLNNLLRSARMGISAVDETWRVTYCNPEAETVFSSQADSLIGRDLREIHVQYDVDLGRLGRGLEGVTPLGSHDFDFSLPREGMLRRYQARVSGIFDAGGQPVGYVLMVHDDTDRRLAEENLERLTRNLEHLVVERTGDLARQTHELTLANARLRGQDEIKSAFFSSVSHELRTPLTSLLGFSKLIARDFARYFRPLTKNDAALAKRAARIEDNLQVLGHEGKRLARLLNDFLDLSRIESGRMNWRDQEISLTEVIKNSVAAVTGLFSSRPELDLEMRLPETSPTVTADPDRLEQVLVNLIGNAAKFTALGAVTVKLSASSAGLVRVSVTDTGPGVAPEDREIIFDKFRQVRRDATSPVPMKGTGLGLAICREIITHYHGRIWTEPAPGRGACFTFELPTTTGAQGPQPEPPSRRSGGNHRALVLVVDDDPAIAAFLLQFLEGEGFRVASAHDGTSAVSAAATLKPDVITMDMAMPGMNGSEAIAALRATPALAAIPIIVITGHEEALPPAADAILRKPLHAEALLEVIDNLLAARGPGPRA